MDRLGNTRFTLDPRQRKLNRSAPELPLGPNPIFPTEGSPSIRTRRKSFSSVTQVVEQVEESKSSSGRTRRRSSTQPTLRTLQELMNSQSESCQTELSPDGQRLEQERNPNFDNLDIELRQKLAALAAQQALHPNMEAFLNKTDAVDSSTPRRRPHSSSRSDSPHSPLSPRSSSSPRRVRQMADDFDSPKRRSKLGLQTSMPSLAQMDDIAANRSLKRRPSSESFGNGMLNLPMPIHQDIPDSHSERSIHTPAGSTANSRRPSRILDASELALAVDVHKVLRAEKDRDAKQVSSRAYNDEDHTDKTLFAIQKLHELYAFQYMGLNPGRSMHSLRRALEMGQATIVVTWFLTIAISVFIALQSAGLLVLSRTLQTWRLKMVETAISEWSSEWLAFFILLAYALLCTCIASCLVCETPRAQGSGIPDLKAFLNGNHIPELFSFQTWLVRGIGLILVTSAGLSAGTEGPCGHLGAIASRGLAKAIFTLFRNNLPSFGHRSCCDFVAMGCAVGVAAAFSAPVGGILFAMEEASSFWSKGLTVRSFVASMLAAAIVKAANVGFSELPSSGFIDFPDQKAGFGMGELLPFLVIAVTTSLLGALFCTCVEHLTRLRLRFYARFTKRLRQALQVLEALSVASITMVVCFWVPLAFGCSRLAEQTNESIWSIGKLARIVCREGYYSDMGTVLLERRETAIKALFTASFDGNAEFGTGRLFLCAAIVFVLTILTYGTALPVGLFVPNMLVGACFGRGIGQIWASMGFKAHPGVHALVGAAGMLAGFGRMAVSLTLIMLEITNSTRLLLPVMMCILLSKAIADRFTESVYDVSIKYHSLQDISLIKGELDEEDMPLLRYLTVHDACSVEVQTLQCEEHPERILATLAQTNFSGFPIVTEKEHQVAGLILRSRLVELLQETNNFRADIAERSTIKLLQYADPAPEVKHWNTPLARAHRHFTAAGLRHLCIVDEAHRLSGILTRSDLAPLSNPRSRQHALRRLYKRRMTELHGDHSDHGDFPDMAGSKYMNIFSSAPNDDDDLSDATSCASSHFGASSSLAPARGSQRWDAY